MHINDIKYCIFQNLQLKVKLIDICYTLKNLLKAFLEFVNNL